MAKQTARRRASGSKKKSPRTIPVKYLFWLVFFILVACLFLLNWKLIHKTISETGVLDRLFRREREDRSFLAEPAAPPPAPVEEPPASPPAAGPSGSTPPASPTPPAPAARPPATPPASPATSSPPRQNPAEPVARPRAETTPPPAAPARAERSIYLIRVDRDGSIVRSRASRSLAATNTPMLDALNALIAGPTAQEAQSGLRSMIPQGTRVLNAWVSDSTAYISFNEEFQFNPFGIEGWVAQLRQVVWTATEFPTVKNVQILIEGKRVDYLGEGIRIRNPLTRDDF